MLYKIYCVYTYIIYIYVLYKIREETNFQKYVLTKFKTLFIHTEICFYVIFIFFNVFFLILNVFYFSQLFKNVKTLLSSQVA